MHIAEARGVPVVAVFGPTVRKFGFFPRGARATVVEHPGLSCRPCTHIGLPRCPLGHFRCMKEITPDTVIVGAERFMS
jgi:heptosyltransferase-2